MNEKKLEPAKPADLKMPPQGIGKQGTTLSQRWTVARTTLLGRLGARTFHLQSGDSIRLFKDSTIHFRPFDRNLQIVDAPTGKRPPWLQTSVNADRLVAEIDRIKVIQLVENAELDQKQKAGFLERLRAASPSVEYLAKLLQIGAAVATIAHYVVETLINLHNLSAAAGTII